MKPEEWRQIPSFPIYEASSWGGIRSRHRHLKPWLDDDGYKSVTVFYGGVRVNRHVHQLVCEAFHGPKPAWASQAAHNNGRKWNNRPENVRWTTAVGNAADKKLHGTELEGERCRFAVFTESQVRTVRIQYRSDPKPATIKRLAEAFMVTPGTIRNIVNGKTWKRSYKPEAA